MAKYKTGTTKVQQKFFKAVKKELHLYELDSVAEAADVSLQTLYNWINNEVTNPHSDTLFRVADTLGFTIEWSKKAHLSAAA